MNDKVYCLISAGGSLSDQACELLFHTARRMWQRKSRAQRVRTKNLEGLVQTKNKIAFIGSIAGIEFSAELDYGKKTIKARYIVRVGKLNARKLKWGRDRILPPEEFLFPNETSNN